jgi:hypothetical protein
VRGARALWAEERGEGRGAGGSCAAAREAHQRAPQTGAASLSASMNTARERRARSLPTPPPLNDLVLHQQLEERPKKGRGRAAR